MSEREVCPDGGDLVWIDFDPELVPENSSGRPALVISPAAFQRNTGRMFVCPIAPGVSGLPTAVPLPEGSPVNGEICVHMAKTVAAVARTAPPIVSAVAMPTSDVLALLAVVLGL